jgi:hypothetical protein
MPLRELVSRGFKHLGCVWPGVKEKNLISVRFTGQKVLKMPVDIGVLWFSVRLAKKQQEAKTKHVVPAGSACFVLSSETTAEDSLVEQRSLLSAIEG